jgi:WD40 repeat protein/serine/threonine protein kinase
MAVVSENKCRECDAVILSGSPDDLCGKCLLSLGLESAKGGLNATALDVDSEVQAQAAGLAGSSIKPSLQTPGPINTEKPGDRIGRYKLREKIGEGGCGVVYVAEQEEPVRREVALKVIKLGMDTKAIVARFEAERQALAMMDHPNIAKVFDAGATETGRPYFVMELVRGTKITDYCDQNNLPTRARLDLFIQVCRAVQHAHQKGIIHRDLKPSNILVTLHDGAPAPKVIDFGIAKATEGRLTDLTIYTELNQFIGTPAYMSPEQVEMGGLDIDTRSDIYSLGVLLYELLTGKTPFDARELLCRGLDEMRRTIREKEPAQPSTRLGTMLEGELAATARQRASEAPKLIHAVRGDLDWIVMKALEKDRTRRYETANGMAMDIQRHLKNETVIARPPSATYRFQKLVRRNKLAVAAAAAVAGVLVLGIVVSTWQAIRATRAERTEIRSRKAAQTAEEGERLQARMARDQLLRLSVANGVRLENAGDLTGALLWFSQSLGLVQGDPDQERVHRLRYASVLQHCPKLIQVLSPTNGAVYAVFSPNGRSVLTINGDATVWDAATGKPITPAFQHAGSMPFNGAFSSDGTRVVVFGPVMNSARVYDARTGDPITPPLVNSNRLFHATFSPDGRRVVTGGWDTRALVWDAASGACVLPPLRHQGVVTQASFSPDNRRILTASFDSTARLWDAATGQELCPPLRHEAAVRNAVFSPDGRYVATASVDRTARLWDANTGKPVGQPLNHPNEVYHVSFNPDGRRLLTSEFDEARIWDLSTGEFLTFKSVAPKGLAGWIRYPLFSPNGKFLVSADSDHTARVYDALTVQPLTPPLPHNGPVIHAAFSPDSRNVVTASADGTARIWEISPSDTRAASSPFRSLVNRAAFSPDHRRFAMASGDGTARLVDALNGNPIGAVLRHDGAVLHICFSPDGQWLATGALDATLRVWDAATGRPFGSPMKQADWVTFACFSPDGRRICAVAGQQLRIWDPMTSQPTTKVMEHSGMIQYAAFSSGGRQLVSACSDGTARVWNAETGEAITPVFRHEQAVFHASFSPDARLVVTASCDRTARVWDAKTGELVMVPLSHDTAVQAAAFNSAGSHILTLTAEGVYSWDLPRENRPVEDLALQAAVLAGRRIDSTGSFSDLAPSESGEGWQRLLAKHSTRLYPPERMDSVEAGPGNAEAGNFLESLEFTRRAPERNEQARLFCIDLSAVVNLPLSAELPNMARGGSLPTLPQGRQKFGGTEFEIGPGVVQFACQYFQLMDREFPKQFPGLKVGRKCHTLHFLHAKRWGSEKEILASYLIHFANGLTWEIPVTSQNQGDVRYSGDEPEGAKGSIVAWTGTNSLGRVRLFQTSWENPLPEVEVENIDLVSAMTFYPAFLVAITVE